jgi:hypothetical protein
VAGDLFAFPGVPDMQSVPDGSAVAVPAPDKAQAAPDSMPDPLALAKLANQFFAALPATGEDGHWKNCD